MVYIEILKISGDTGMARKKANIITLDNCLIHPDSGGSNAISRCDWTFNKAAIKLLRILLRQTKAEVLIVICNYDAWCVKEISPKYLEERWTYVFSRLYNNCYLGLDLKNVDVRYEGTTRVQGDDPMLLGDLSDIDIAQSLMIGSNSGLEGDYSDRDKALAERVGLEYFDISESTQVYLGEAYKKRGEAKFTKRYIKS